MITIVAVLFIVSGLAIFFLSLPLIYRKVSMNALYGIRIRRALESQERWYDINAYGGRQLARWSWMITAVGAMGFFVPAEHLFIYTLAGAGIVVVSTLAPIFQVLIWSRNNAAS